MSNNCVWRETTACKGFPWEPESQPAQENMKMLYQVCTMCAVHFDVSCDTELGGSWSHQAPEPCCGWCSQGLLLSWPNPLQAASAWLRNSVYTRWKFGWPLGIKFGNFSFTVSIYLSKKSPFSLWEDRTRQTMLLMPVLDL